MKAFIYNTQQNDLILKEYGRNVQKLVDHIITIQDKDKRTKYAQLLVELMRQIHPNMRDNQDYSNKLWDDLYILSGFNLEVDSPYPMPEKTLLGKKPKRVGYNTHELHYKHYGRNVELMIEKAIVMENPDERFAAIVHIGRLMKSFYSTWNKENVDDALIVEHLRELSDNKLEISLEKVKAEGLFDASGKERTDNRDNRGSGGDRNKPYGNNANKKNNNRKMDKKRK
ncbi:DUF4290 domain-containing protein [Rhodocytophaga aerolata]|uniref:DUF4290 domain-containing protein n=1 Tax=Rhodocytophaga aerolata TaxID=455078 RepID=A0ABT8R987_9BACT|nr:DUF4290 domain-containing protein [Rhodocytophaga aerolata]MDO1447833.1 DUF4290 domain-containing protein [Rhodocytophaga aerolata]